MKKGLLFLLVLIHSVFVEAQNFNWAKRIGGNGSDEGNAITVDASGNIYAVSDFTATADFDPGPGVYNFTASTAYDGALLKLDNNGGFLWARHLKSKSTTSRPMAVKTDAFGDVYVTGYFGDSTNFDVGNSNFTLVPRTGIYEYYIAKWSATGNFLWAKQFGGESISNNHFLSLTIDNSGNLLFTGGFDRKSDFDPSTTSSYSLTPYFSTKEDIFVLKLDPSGNMLWAEMMGSTSVDAGQAITCDGAGNSYVTGFFETTADMDPGGPVLNLTSIGPKDEFVLKLDPSGNLVWVKQFGGAGALLYGTSVKVNSMGEVTTCGSYNGVADFDPGSATYTLTTFSNTDISILKLDAAGNFVWAKGFGGNYLDLAFELVQDASGNIYTAGSYVNTVDFDPGPSTYTLASCGVTDDIFVQKLDPAGNFVWAFSMGGCGLNQAFGIFVDNYLNIYTTGRLGGTGDFDPGAGVFNMTALGNTDIYIDKLSPSCSAPAPPLNSTASANQNICTGGTSTLNVSGPGYYLWYGSPTSTNVIATGNSYSTPVLTPGTYTYYVESITCASSLSRTAVSLTVNPPPSLTLAVSPTITCGTSPVGPPVNLTGYPSGGVCSGLYVGGAVFNPSLNLISPGTYTVAYTYTDPITGCSNATTNTVMVSTCTEINEISRASYSILLYPNPSAGEFRITLEQSIENAYIELFAGIGKVVLKQALTNGINEINCTHLAKGIYIYSVFEKDNLITRGRLAIE